MVSSTQEKPARPESASSWLSIGLEVLMDRLAEERRTRPRTGPDFDVLIVGSGYGGAAAAAQLSACAEAASAPDAAEGEVLPSPLRIAVLERGREYLAGQFPSTMAELSGHVRFASPGDTAPRGRREGLFDLRLGPDMSVALANGLGGGSLINAGVMEPALDAVFSQPPWPRGLRETAAPLRDWYAQAARLLGAEDARGANTIDRLDTHAPRRADWLQGLGGKASRPALTIALDAQPLSPAGLDLQRCIACGDCATGCNHGAKLSLDTSLLLQAAQRGVQLVTGAGVLRVLPLPPGEAGWRIELNHTDEFLQRRQVEPLVLTARRVILAAGSLGSTEILLRSRAAGLPLSDRLGEQFSGNGDVLAAAVSVPRPVDAIADEAQAPTARRVGPTITAMLDQREEAGFVVQDLAIPGPLRWLFEEGFALAGGLDGLARGDDSEHLAGDTFDDPHSVSDHASTHTLPIAMMGSDAAIGRLRLAVGAAEGTLSVDWPEARRDARVDQRHAWLDAQLAKQGARLLANPLWRLLPRSLEHLLGGARGPMVSVHPLGGCAMGDSAAEGVVDEWGRVYSGQGSSGAVHAGLAVLDGAIVPAALGINPALTITALALRALAQLKADWGLVERPAELPKPGPRPVYREIAPHADTRANPTEVEIRERMAGFVRLPGAPGGELKYAEFTFIYAPVAVRQLLRAGPQRRLHIAPGQGQGTLRIFDAAPDPDAPGRLMVTRNGAKLWMHAERADGDARWVAPLRTAELRLFNRAPRSAGTRRWQALRAWFFNRGWRDGLQFLFEAWSDAKAAEPNQPRLWPRLRQQARDAWALASHGGEVRLMAYDIEIGRPAGDVPAWAQPLVGQRIEGSKRISYTRRGNPWQQLSTLMLGRGPFQPLEGTPAVRLELCLFYLARQGVPLLRLTQAQDAPSAIRDLGSLAGFFARMMIGLHVWSFRKPDAALPREIDRLPGAVPGLPAPEVIELAAGRRGQAGASRQPIVPPPADDTPVMIRLTRYRGARPGARPILLLHGYSASGTSFAHHSVQPGPARLLWDAGWDVWLLDMRTSAGMPTARLPWTFEEAALNDIPLAVEQVVKASGFAQIDVLAHCMGSVMLNMAMLEPREQACEHFYPLRQRLQGRIRRLVISQVTPKMIFSPTNTLRAFLLQHVRRYLPLDDYAFRVDGEPGLLDQLTDRLLASLPYPEEEFDLENPPFPRWKKTPWTATRHRMDLLYGRDFALSNVDAPVLDFIDDHFGPLNLDTVAQAVNFARSNEITDWRGASVYLDDLAKSMALLRSFKVLSLHGQDNGLCEAESAELTAEHFQHVGPGRYRFHVVSGHGHQDCLIGRHAATQVFPEIIRFLNEDDAPPAPEAAHVPDGVPADLAPKASAMSAQPPLIRSESALDAGSGDGRAERVHVLTALRPEHGWPRLWAWVPVRLRDDGAVEPLDPLDQGLRILPFDRGALDIGDPLRQPLPLAWFPAPVDGERRGLLGLFIYAHPQALAFEGGNEALLNEPDRAELCQVLRERLDDGDAELALGLVLRPERVDEGPLGFIVAACQYPPGLLDHSADALARPASAGPAEAALARLVAFCRRPALGRETSLLVFAGDQIYADASSGLFDPGNQVDRYAQPYLAFKSGLIRHLPPSVARVVHVPDDHEIEDGWEPIANAAQPDGPWFATARQAAWTHRWNPLPGPVRPERFWHHFAWRGGAFFIGDSRTERQARRLDRWREAEMVSPEQRAALRQWLADNAARPRFVVTSALLLPRRRQTRDHAASALRSDAWDGYPASLHGLLGDIWTAQSQGVVFLSGDEHRSGFVSATVQAVEGNAAPVRLHSIHSSGLYSPWPFAVTRTEDFAAPDSFTFAGPGGQVLRCTVSDWTDHPGDGFAALRVVGDRLELRFDRAGRPLHEAGDAAAPDGVFELA